MSARGDDNAAMRKVAKSASNVSVKEAQHLAGLGAVDLGSEPDIPCVDVVLSYLSGEEVGVLSENCQWPVLQKDSFWSGVVEATLARYSFFAGARKMLKGSLVTSPAIVEKTYKEFFFVRLFPILKDLVVFQRVYEAEKPGESWNEDLEQDLTICAYLTPTSGGTADPLHFAAAEIDRVGGRTVDIDVADSLKYKQELKENACFIAQISASTYRGLLATEGLLPPDGGLLLLLKAEDMNNGGGSLLNVGGATLDAKRKQTRVQGNFPKFMIGGVFERLESKSAIPWEVSVEVKKEYLKRYPGRETTHNTSGPQLEAWMGGRSTSQQGYNEVEEKDFLVLQANFDGDFDSFMDGIEVYFIMDRAKLELSPKDLSYNAKDCNFSLYANC